MPMNESVYTSSDATDDKPKVYVSSLTAHMVQANYSFTVAEYTFVEYNYYL